MADITIRWLGPDGSVWDWLAGTEGAILTEGLGSLVLPELQARATRLAQVPGRVFHGLSYQGRSVEFTLHVGDTTATAPGGVWRAEQDWRELSSRFHRSLSPLLPGVLEITTYTSGVRTLPCRLGELETTLTAGKEAGLRGSATYSGTLDPDDPLWQGQTLTLDFPYVAATPGEDYYGGPGGGGLGPPFHIGEANDPVSFTILNGGDEQTWPVWTVTGPCQAIVGIGAALTEVDYLGAGETLTIDTHPARMSVVDGNGNRAWDRLSAGYDFAPIPPGDQPTATATKNGAAAGASIRLAYTLQHFAPW